jgi:hypothetical protein
MAGDKFGKGLAVIVNQRTGKTYVAVGAPGHGEKGAIFIFEKNQGGERNWGFVEKIVPSDLSLNAQFGCSVDISGSTMVVGAGNQQGTGAVYVFNETDEGYKQVQKLTPPGNPPNSQFGFDVSVSKKGTGIGAPAEDNDKGAGYFFARDEFNPLIFALSAIRFFSNHAVSGDRFATSVVLTATMIAFGGPGVTGWPGGTQLVGRGAVWVFLFSVALATWVHFAVLWGQEALGFFGYNLAINPFNDLIVAAIGATSRLGVIAGAAFLFLFNPFLNIFELPDKIIPSTFIDAAMQLGTALVLLDCFLFLGGSAYSANMGAVFLLKLTVVAFTFALWLLLFISLEELNDPANANRFRKEDDPDLDGLALGVEYKQNRNPIVAEFGTQKPRISRDGNFKYSYQESNVASEGTSVVEYYHAATRAWVPVDYGPTGSFKHSIRKIGLRSNLHVISERDPLDRDSLLLHYNAK